MPYNNPKRDDTGYCYRVMGIVFMLISCRRVIMKMCFYE
jgi:hypothetical protein